MWPFLFSKRFKIRSTVEAEKERMKFKEDYRFFMALREKGIPDRYAELEEKINSESFKRSCRELRRFSWRRKPSRIRWSESEEYRLLKEYSKLKKSSELHRYQNLKKSVIFNQYAVWKLSFEDVFNTFDSSRWIRRYYAGEFFLKDTYGVGKDAQVFMPANVSIRKERLFLEFRKEEINGKYWDPRLGIVAKKYGYTSGMVNTALSFRQYLGRFEVKLKVEADSCLERCFWLSGEGIYPHVNVVKFGRKGYEADCFSQERSGIPESERMQKKVKLKSGFYIFTFDWLEDKMVWKINDCVVKTQEIHLPVVSPMYVCLSLGATENLEGVRLPEKMEVDWIRCYTKNGKE